MAKDKDFAYKKFQIDQYLKKEYQKAFGDSGGRISLRKRQRFMDKITQKVARKFGKDVLCLIDFNRRGFTTLLSPSETQSTDKGKLFKSFTHPQVAYTSHCVDRFSQRTDTQENCILSLDGYLEEALLTFGHHKEHLVCTAGIFAYQIEDEQIILKTFIGTQMLSDQQVREFYGHDVLAKMSSGDYVAEETIESDIILGEEFPQVSSKT